MPFINDRIEDTKRKQNEADALALSQAGKRENSHSISFDSRIGRFRFDPVAVVAELEATIVGQSHAKQLIFDVLSAALIGLGDPRKPISSILFGGPTGVGKTEIIRNVARAIHGDDNALCRIDMNTLSQEHYAAAFSGAPPGYVGSKEGTTLLDQEKIEGTSSLPGIVLFDELEKASNEVVLALLNILDNGVLTIASGERTISFRNSIIFMTTNVGSRMPVYSRLFARLVDREKSISAGDNALISTLLQRYPIEFVNRIDHVHKFHGLQPDALVELINLQMQIINRRLAKHRVSLFIDDDLKRFLCREGFQKKFGARELHRVVRTKIEFPLARYLTVSRPELIGKDGIVHLRAHRVNGQMRFDVEE